MIQQAQSIRILENQLFEKFASDPLLSKQLLKKLKQSNYLLLPSFSFMLFYPK